MPAVRRPPPSWPSRLRVAGSDPLVPMMVVAVGVGTLAAAAVELFRRAMLALVALYSGQLHLEAAAAALPLAQRWLIPLLAALAAGLLMGLGQRRFGRRPGPEYMEAVRVGDGRLPLRANLLRTMASLLAVSGGITIGREGTMIQFAAVMSGQIGRWPGFDAAQRRLIVACGAAAGFAAAYHAPIAGSLFVAEVILGGLQLREIAAVLVAAVVGELTTQSLSAAGPLYLAQTVGVVGWSDLFDSVLLGVLSGLLGPALLWLLDSSRRLLQSRLSWPPLRLALAGLVIGLLSLLRPEVWGNGYSLVQSMLIQPWALGALGLVLLLRLLALTAASAAGIPGGVLTPTLALGAGVGLAVSQLLLLPAASHASVLWALVGMASLLAATTHAPAMSAILVFEMTRNYNAVLAAMPASVLASVLASLLRPRSVYAEALGLGDEAEAGAGAGR